MAKKRKKTTRTKKGKTKKQLEWVCGRFTPPFFIEEDSTVSNGVLVWIEVPKGDIVGMEVGHLNDPSLNAGTALLHAMAAPYEGKPRRPARVRVSDPSLAKEISKVVPDMKVVIAPTPEIEEIKFALNEYLENNGPSYNSYLENNISPDTIHQLFRAALIFYKLAPWRFVAQGDIIRVDIPKLGFEGACVSIIGSDGIDYGMVIFPSLEAFDHFVNFAESFNIERPDKNIGTQILSLNFDNKKYIPESMLQEIETHNWPVADENAYPWILYLDADGSSLPFTEREIKIISATAIALTGFVAKNSHLFLQEDNEDDIEASCESYLSDDGIEVIVTYPYDAYPFFEIHGSLDKKEEPCEKKE